jgi:ribonucleoside-diphosphate reductase beta chain
MREAQTTTAKRLAYDSLPYRLFQKAKKFGVWNPADIDFSQDKKDWLELTPAQRDATLRLVAQFQAGEEVVTNDILPLVLAIAREGRVEEEMYLSTFYFEEAKHTEFFRRWLDEVPGEKGDLTHYLSPSYRKIFFEELPAVMERLFEDRSPEAIAVAATTYNLFVEGVLAESAYFAFYESVDKIKKLPGLMKGIGYIKLDESRHIGYGTYLLHRLICEHEHLHAIIVQKLESLMPITFGIIQEALATYPDGQDPFGNDPGTLVNFATKQLNVRMEVLKRAHGKKIEEVYRMSEEELGIA